MVEISRLPIVVGPGNTCVNIEVQNRYGAAHKQVRTKRVDVGSRSGAVAKKVGSVRSIVPLPVATTFGPTWSSVMMTDAFAAHRKRAPPGCSSSTLLCFSFSLVIENIECGLILLILCATYFCCYAATTIEPNERSKCA